MSDDKDKPILPPFSTLTRTRTSLEANSEYSENTSVPFSEVHVSRPLYRHTYSHPYPQRTTAMNYHPSQVYYSRAAEIRNIPYNPQPYPIPARISTSMNPQHPYNPQPINTTSPVENLRHPSSAPVYSQEYYYTPVVYDRPSLSANLPSAPVASPPKSAPEHQNINFFKDEKASPVLDYSNGSEYSDSDHQGKSPSDGNGPFTCTECNLSFARCHDLKRHERIHLQVRPFECIPCGKSFIRKDTLYKHQRSKSHYYMVALSEKNTDKESNLN